MVTLYLDAPRVRGGSVAVHTGGTAILPAAENRPSATAPPHHSSARRRREAPPLEELGTFYKTGDDDPEFRTMFRTFYDGELHADRSEVEEWKWVSVEELRRDAAEHPEEYSGTFHEVVRNSFN